MSEMEQKKELRKRGIQARNLLTSEKRTTYSVRIAEQVISLDEFQRAHTILIYKATAGEVNLELLETSLKAQDKRFVYPYCISKSEMTALQPYDEDAWVTGRYGILEPMPERSREILPEEIDLVICPCTAFDEACNRIGMGAGYYDRYLKLCTNTNIIAVAFETQKVKEVPVEPWDRAMEKIITEQSIYCP